MSTKAVVLIKKAKSYDNSKYSKLLEKAVDFSREAHNKQRRESGELFFVHPLAVASILVDMKLDSLTIIGALLHDTVEDTTVTLKKITKIFGKEVADLVDGVTKLTRIESTNEIVIQAENFRKLIIAISKDLRVLVIKLADRMHNMQTLHYIKSDVRRHRIALETLEIFAPLAERIGMQYIKNELQDLAFQDLYPEVRKSIVARLELLKKDEAVLPKKIISELKKLLNFHKIKCKIFGREKAPYSIWDKMKRKDINFEQLSDVMAFRIITEDIVECYKVLGVIHSSYHAIPGKFKDFISTPKKNDYKSLHTVVIGPEKHKIEIQIKTQEMYEISNIGVAAHWCYKQDYDHIEGLKYNWIKELLQILEVSSDSRELLETTKLEMYYDQVFCFTPNGQVIALPKGASAIDFAYAVHSDVGNTCTGVKINKRIAPLRTELQNGDQVEVMTNPDHNPMPSWEKFVVTGKALSEIRKSIRQEKIQEYINLGRVIVIQLFEEEEVKYSEEKLGHAIKFFNKSSREDLLLAVGGGYISKENLLKNIFPAKKTIKLKNKLSLFSFINRSKKSSDKKLSIKGLIADMAVHFAACCHPIPGDSIIGIQQTGKGITVHISDCETLQNYSSTPEKWLDLAWDKNDKQEIYTASINAIIVNKPGTLSDISSEVSSHDANINNFRIRSRAVDFFEITLDLEVKGLHHLTNIIASMRSKPCVHSVNRYLK